MGGLTQTACLTSSQAVSRLLVYGSHCDCEGPWPLCRWGPLFGKPSRPFQQAPLLMLVCGLHVSRSSFQEGLTAQLQGVQSAGGLLLWAPSESASLQNLAHPRSCPPQSSPHLVTEQDGGGKSWLFHWTLDNSLLGVACVIIQLLW